MKLSELIRKAAKIQEDLKLDFDALATKYSRKNGYNVRANLLYELERLNFYSMEKFNVRVA